MTKTLGSFKLTIEEGSFTNCEIIVLLGENGTGKTTFVRMLSGDKKCAPDDVAFDVISFYFIFRSQNSQSATNLKLSHPNSQELYKNFSMISLRR